LFGVRVGAVHEDDEVVRVADEAIRRLAAAAAPVPGAGVTHRRPRGGEVLIQHRQRDVGQ
jgi:hypothetical protein